MATDYPRNYGSRTYFFWNEKPYKILKEFKRKNLLIAWDLLDKRRVSFVWTDWKKHHKKALQTGDVATILGRGKHIICRHIDRGKIPSPYYIEIPKRGNPPLTKFYLWQEKDILHARELFEQFRPDNYDVSEAEVKAMLNDEEVIYFIQTDDGDFIPTWKAR